MVIALPTWGDLSSTLQTVFGSWFVVGICSENAPGRVEKAMVLSFRLRNTWGSFYTGVPGPPPQFRGEKRTFSLIDAVHGPHLTKGIAGLTISIEIPCRDVIG